MQWLGWSNWTPPYLVAYALTVLLFWPWAAWVYRHAYVRPVRQAMRDAGHDVCVGCGYDLTGLGDGSNRCPECGWPIPVTGKG